MKIFIALILSCLPAFADNDLFKFDRNKPVRITAESLIVDDISNTGTFSGIVDIIQGNFRLSGDKVIIFYEKKSDNNKVKSITQNKINKLEAEGNIILSSTLENTARGNKMVYDVIGEVITLEGNALVSRKNSVITADKVKVNTKTKKISILSSINNRVKTLINIDDFEDSN